MKEEGTLGKMWPVRPLRVNEFLKKRQGYVWYQDEISLAEHRIVGPFQFGTTGRNELKTPTQSTINSGRNWRKKDRRGK